VNAPDAQAALPLGQRASEVPAAARTYLAEARDYLRTRHAAGDSGRDVNKAHSDLIDGLVPAPVRAVRGAVPERGRRGAERVLRGGGRAATRGAR
jgi:hypothetical protein